MSEGELHQRFCCAESILHSLNDKGIVDVPEELLKAVTGFGIGMSGKV